MLGVALAYATNYFVASSFFNSFDPLVWAWKVGFGFLGILVVILFGVSLFVNQTPKCFLDQGNFDEAQNALRRLRNGFSDRDIEFEWAELVDTARDEKERNPWVELLQHQHLPILVIRTLSQ